ncbi:hypothetical protein [Promineifilum sp.]|uniref:hypothetical protein n=1 Tax=Promineifilum sp. TaxID=2664178 RepID=UPI0035AF6F46
MSPAVVDLRTTSVSAGEEAVGQTALWGLRKVLAALPAGLGWGSETLTEHLRKSRGAWGQGGKGEDADPFMAALVARACQQVASASFNDVATPLSCAPARPLLLKLFPDLALGILRTERAAAGRVWLLLRHLDEAGRGWLDVAEARAALTDKASPLRLCGWRRLRGLLAEGQGVFWTRDDRGRLWLHGPARVAAALGVGQLRHRPVGVPIAALLGGIGDARAQLYAAFHSGRARSASLADGARAGGRAAASSGAPIARATLAELSGACPRSQVAYERRAGVAARGNVAIVERVAAGTEQERAWQRGRALFRLTDYRGQQGRPGAVYLAWRLPNGYGAARDHQQRPRGRQKRINRKLADLFTKGMTGNGGRPIEKRYFAGAAAAWKRAERGPGAGERGSRGAGGKEAPSARCFSSLHPRTPAPLPSLYWPDGRTRRGIGVWRVVDAEPLHAGTLAAEGVALQSSLWPAGGAAEGRR